LLQCALPCAGAFLYEAYNPDDSDDDYGGPPKRATGARTGRAQVASVTPAGGRGGSATGGAGGAGAGRQGLPQCTPAAPTPLAQAPQTSSQPSLDDYGDDYGGGGYSGGGSAYRGGVLRHEAAAWGGPPKVNSSSSSSSAQRNTSVAAGRAAAPPGQAAVASAALKEALARGQATTQPHPAPLQPPPAQGQPQQHRQPELGQLQGRGAGAAPGGKGDAGVMQQQQEQQQQQQQEEEESEWEDWEEEQPVPSAASLPAISKQDPTSPTPPSMPAAALAAVPAAAPAAASVLGEIMRQQKALRKQLDALDKVANQLLASPGMVQVRSGPACMSARVLSLSARGCKQWCCSSPPLGMRSGHAPVTGGILAPCASCSTSLVPAIPDSECTNSHISNHVHQLGNRQIAQSTSSWKSSTDAK